MAQTTTICLAGDVMLARGIDQIQAHPGNRELRESYVKDARAYVKLAERRHGPIRAPVSPAYIWGATTRELERFEVESFVVNLETSITHSDSFWPDKAVHYRMAPENIECLRAGRVDVCALANNHVLDFGREGLVETLSTLDRAGIRHAGAGLNLSQAEAPARVPLHADRTLAVFACGFASSGIPAAWASGPHTPGVYLPVGPLQRYAQELAARVRAERKPGDLAVVSIHWGSNWGYEIDAQQIELAHRLIDHGVDVVHGHSSHHMRAVEVYRGKLVLYGCGDLITDYEGIRRHDEFRGDLGGLFMVTLAADGSLAQLKIVPTRLIRLQLTRPPPSDVDWLLKTLNRVGVDHGSAFELDAAGNIAWTGQAAGASREPH